MRSRSCEPRSAAATFCDLPFAISASLPRPHRGRGLSPRVKRRGPERRATRGPRRSTHPAPRTGGAPSTRSPTPNAPCPQARGCRGNRRFPGISSDRVFITDLRAAINHSRPTYIRLRPPNVNSCSPRNRPPNPSVSPCVRQLARFLLLRFLRRASGPSVDLDPRARESLLPVLMRPALIAP